MNGGRSARKRGLVCAEDEFFQPKKQGGGGLGRREFAYVPKECHSLHAESGAPGCGTSVALRYPPSATIVPKSCSTRRRVVK